MKIDENEQMDKYGGTPCCRVSGSDANYQKIFEFLHRSYQGYKFAVIFDSTKDEYEEPEKQTPIYFFDELFDEMVDYIGIDKVKRMIAEKER